MRALAPHHEHAVDPPAPREAPGVSLPPSALLSLLPSLFGASFASLFGASFASLFASAFAPLAAAFAPLFLKSVAYQPLPLSWKPAAVSSFWNVSLPHALHVVSGASLHFCRNSCWWPQLEQRYS